VLSDISPSTELIIGIGIPRADGSGCLLTISTTATGGATTGVSASVPVGTFCVQVFAPAQTANVVNFRVALTHP
ncbi:MAG TPA: hypothetical protein VMW48_08935, partial [Vicinamibacterales bacterium]|nr:hypothetical protein [Vicinamibacterales bacterium]